MPTISQIDAWRAAELELRTAQNAFGRAHLADPDRLFLDDVHVVLLMARRTALRAMHAALVGARLTMSGPLWTAWHSKVLEYETRIIEFTRRAANLESCMGIATSRGAEDIAGEAMLREAQHALGLYKAGLMVLLEHPQRSAYLDCRSHDVRPRDPRRGGALH